MVSRLRLYCGGEDLPAVLGGGVFTSSTPGYCEWLSVLNLSMS